MHRSERENLVTCVACGSETAGSLERGFSIGADSVLCYECAKQRGGRWDEERAIWTREPDVAGLARPVDPEGR